MVDDAAHELASERFGVVVGGGIGLTLLFLVHSRHHYFLLTDNSRLIADNLFEFSGRFAFVVVALSFVGHCCRQRGGGISTLIISIIIFVTKFLKVF